MIIRLQTFAAVIVVVGLVIGAISPPAQAQTARKKPPVTNAVKGQGQVSGLYAQFGMTYTLKSHFNFTLLKAHYTLEPYVSSEPLIPKGDQKLLILDMALKNVATDDNAFNQSSFITLVDEKGQLYNTASGSLSLKSMGKKFPDTKLKPGQGIGQPGLHDPLQIGFAIPGNARIVKIIVNIGRLGKSEDVMRYNIAGATKEEAGAPGDPLNVIAPLPDNIRDPADKSGAVALAEGNGKIGEPVPSGNYTLRVDNIAVSTDKFNNSDAPTGKKYIVATVMAKYVMQETGNMGYVEGGFSPEIALTDTDGERYRPLGYRKAKRDEEPDHTFEPGDEYAYRLFFVVPKDVTLKKLILATANATKWDYDVSSVQ